MTAKLNQTVRKGDTFLRTPTYRLKSTKEGIDISGSTVSGKIVLDTEEHAFTCTLVDAPNGVFSFGLSAGVTATLKVATYAMELKITFADNTVKTLFTGNFVVTA